MSILLQILQFLPAILQGVTAVERVIGGGKGQAKKAIIMSSITAAAKAGETVPNGTVAAISSTIDTVVGELNTAGVFTHGQPPAPTVTAA